MDKFFNRPPEEVASELVGMTLRLEDHEALIEDVLPQGEKGNKSWTDRPLFAAGVEAYVAPYRGSHLLFLRTGPTACNTCIRVDFIELDNRQYTAPGKVCKALGLKSEQTGRASVTRDIVTLTFSEKAG